MNARRRKRKPAAVRYAVRLGVGHYVCLDGGRLWLSRDVADAMIFADRDGAQRFLNASRSQLPDAARIEIVEA